MRKFTWIFVASLTAVAPWACVETTLPGSPSGVGGAGSSGITTGSKPGTTKAASAGSTNTGGALSCEGNFKAACNECITASCCAEFAECQGTDGCEACVSGEPTCTEDNINIAQLTFDCVKSACAAACIEPPTQVDPICKVPTGSPSKGACAPLGGNVKCNPVTNAPCKTAAGEACDLNDQDVFTCFPAPNTEALCAACDNQKTFCQAGLTCVGDQCARYCCDDSDCGAGKCDKGSLELPSNLGVCVVNHEAPDGGADGGGNDGGSVDGGGTGGGPADGGVSSAASGGPLDGGGPLDDGGPLDGGSADSSP
jgi:hypothetical protein